jgi:hypothetical protein
MSCDLSDVMEEVMEAEAMVAGVTVEAVTDKLLSS